ncbi:MAG: hypothetical protein M0T74_02325, partial [Desulfitobacterium hafniense]|nr:hypothetical protein [Desulfitobacterium hafniense]
HHKERVDILANALEEVTKDPEFQKAAAAVNLQVKFLKGEDFKKFLADQNKQLGQIVKDMGLEGK